MKRIILLDRHDECNGIYDYVTSVFNLVRTSSTDDFLEVVSNNKNFDAIIINFDFIGKSIYKVLCQIQDDANLSCIPIIVTTTKTDSYEQERLLISGVDDVIIFPIYKDLFIRKISVNICTASKIRYDDIRIKASGMNFYLDILEDDVKFSGAFLVNRREFSLIYHFVKRILERTEQNVQTLLFTLNKHDIDDPDYASEIKMLKNAVAICLRRGDVSTIFSENQVLVLLMNADDNGGHLVAHRILSNFYSEYDGKSCILSYDIRNMHCDSRNNKI